MASVADDPTGEGAGEHVEQQQPGSLPSPEEPAAPRDKWDGRFTTLGGEIYTLRMYRTFWREFIKAAEEAKVTPGHIFDFFAATYSTRQAVAIRRLCGFRSREYGFHHLLSRDSRQPSVVQEPT
jgi:hypothetical protein